MNVKNNKRRRDSLEKIETVFVQLLREKELHKISVAEICKKTGLNRSTFYSNYIDIYDLAYKVGEKLEADFDRIFSDEKNDNGKGAVRMFRHICENRERYETYFKLGFDNRYEIFVYDRKRAEKDFGNKNIEYHIEFFRNGLNAIVKKWISGGCKETPEEMAEILKSEYRGR